MSSTNSGSAESVVGDQRPRIFHAPRVRRSSVDEVVDLAEMAGLYLDDWQRFVLCHALGEKPDGKWAASRVGLVVGRQNGKNSILEARELAGIFLFGERLIIHTAHEQPTASVQHQRLVDRLRESPKLWSRVARPIYGKGSEAIRFKSGQEILFRTRTGSAGKGMTVDCLVFDEAFNLTDAAMSALLPTMAARSKGGNLQRWYTSSAVDQQNSKHDGLVLARIRERGLEGDADDLAYFEWSVDWGDPDTVPEAMASDPRVTAKANPAQGVRITREWIESERTGGEMSARGWAVERLGVGDWPATSAGAARVIAAEAWNGLADPGSRIESGHLFAVDMCPDQAWATISAAGVRDDGLYHVGVVDHRRGTEWIVPALVDWLAQFPDARLVLDPFVMGSKLPDLEAAGIQPVTMTARDYADACGGFFAAVTEKTLRYMPPQPELDAAVAGARTKPLLDNAWKWSRDRSGVVITSLVSCTLALWGARTQSVPEVHNLNEVAARLLREREGQSEPEPVPEPVQVAGQRFIPFDQMPVRHGVFRY